MMDLRSGSSVLSGSAENKRVAVIGARGIGRHHARWWHLEGAHVCAFLGTSSDNLEMAREAMGNLFPVDAEGYTDQRLMLEKETPDFVDVCSPNAFHYHLVRRALWAGCHVLCEKPLLYNPFLTSNEMMAQATELVALAKSANLWLGLCSQYSVATRICTELFNQFRPGEEITEFRGTLASPAGERNPDPLSAWIDLGPHLLAAVETLAPGGMSGISLNSRKFEGCHASCEFNAVRQGKKPLNCRLEVFHTTDFPKNIRRLVFNNLVFDIQGENDDEDIFRTKIVTEKGIFYYEDIMHLLIREMAGGQPPIQGQAILNNLKALLDIAAG